MSVAKKFIFYFSFLLVTGSTPGVCWAAAYVQWNTSYALWYPIIDSSANVAISSSALHALPFPQPTVSPAQSPTFVEPPTAGTTPGTLLADAPYFSTSQPIAQQTLFIQVNGGKAFALPDIQLPQLPASTLALKSFIDTIALTPEPKAFDEQTRTRFNLALQSALKEFPPGQYRLTFFYR